MSEQPQLGPPPLRPPVYQPVSVTHQGGMCKLHTGVAAAHRSACCNGLMCETCDFNLGGGLHVCPTCAMASAVQGLGPRRKRNVIVGYTFATIGTITLFLLLIGAFASMVASPSSQMMAGVIVILLVPLPAAVGFGVASSAIERHLPNTFAIWGAVIWNLLLVVAFIGRVVSLSF